MKEELWRPSDPDFFRNPYPYYKRLRDLSPVYRASSGEYIISTYTLVKKVLTDDRFITGNRLDFITRSAEYLRTKDQDLSSIVAAMTKFLLMLNPPDHTRLRRHVYECWDINYIHTGIEIHIADTLAEIKVGETFDLVSTVSRAITANTISLLLGIPHKDVTKLQSDSMALVKSIDAYPTLQDLLKMNDAAANFIQYFKEAIAESNIRKTSVFGNIIKSNKSDKLTIEELTSLGLFLFLAGTETTASSISLSVLNYIQQPQNFQINHSELDNLVNEIMRFNGPVHLLGRIAREEIILQGVKIPPNSIITLLLASANRDNAVFNDADKFIPYRQPNRHLAFGQGRHYCMGDQLARYQLQAFWSEILNRQMRFELAGEVIYENQLSIRSIKSLPLKRIL